MFYFFILEGLGAAATATQLRDLGILSEQRFIFTPAAHPPQVMSFYLHSCDSRTQAGDNPAGVLKSPR